jgi:16S rRNA (guanine966-N2)-methyltransferase
MRVIAGIYRSRTVKAPKNIKIRPTADKVKGALFNMLEPVEGCTVVDFYSGTGNLGIEALSRRAKEVVFVDKAFESMKLLQENLQSLGINPRDPKNNVRLLTSEVSKAFYLLYQEGKKFDILMADPPYEVGALKRIQSLLMEYPILNNGGILAIEHGGKDIQLEPKFPFPVVRQKKYGDTLLTLFKNGIVGGQADKN